MRPDKLVSFAVAISTSQNVTIILDSGARRIANVASSRCMEDHQPAVAEAVLCKWGGARSAWVGYGEPRNLTVL